MPRTASLTPALLLVSCAAFAVQFLVENYAAPQGESATALRAYLSMKWMLALDAPVPQNPRAILRRLGVKSDPLFSSILIMR